MDIQNNEKVKALVEELLHKAEREDIQIDKEDAIQEIYFALLEYYNCRHYTPTDEKPYEEIYHGIIISLAIASISKRGAEGETGHKEGGVDRTYDSSSSYPLALTRKIIPLAKGV